MNLHGAAEGEREHGPQRDVFVTYNSEDLSAMPLVEAIVAVLDAAQHRSWYAPRDKVAGDPSEELMVEAVASTKCCALFLGAEGAGQWQERFELRHANNRAIEDPSYRVFAVLLPGAGPDTVPPSNRINSRVDLTQCFEGTRLTPEGEREILAAVGGVSVSELERGRQTSQDGVTHGRRRALLIGVSKYDDRGFSKLNGPRNDILHVERALRSSGAPIRWDVQQVADPELKMFVERVGSFIADTKAEDTLLVYYSGHGVVVDGSSQLVARDTVRHPFVAASLAVGTLVRQLEASRAASKVLILDCCHAAPLGEADPYPGLGGDDLAVVAASHGLADDAKDEGDVSPFTRQLVQSLRKATTPGPTTLTVGGLLTELRGQGVRTWTNPRCARGIPLIAPAGAPAVEAPVTRIPALEVVVRPECLATERLGLVRQLGETLDALLAMAGKERDVPSSVVRRSVLLIAAELGHAVMSDEQLSELAALPPDHAGKLRLALRFADHEIRARTADLPWEYLAFCGVTPDRVHATVKDVTSARAPVERLFAAAGTKNAYGDPQAVALFSTLRGSGAGVPHIVTETAARQFDELGLESETTTSVTWSQFAGSPDSADLVVLQVPLTWGEDGEAKALFAPKSADDAPKQVRASDLADTLAASRGALSHVFLETLADTSRAGSAAALRCYADDLATRLKRPVVGVCHARAYAGAVTDTQTARSFMPHVVQGLKSGESLELAAHAARVRVVSTLAADEPAIVGIPVVVRPEREGSEPKPVPKFPTPTPPTASA